MENILKLVGDNKDIILFIVGIVVLIIKNMLNGRKFKNALILAINAMKDESKIKDDKFDFSLVKKVKEINKLHVGDAKAAKEVEKLIESMNNKDGMKVGSYKGKPIYVRDVAGVIGMLGGIFRKN